MPLEPVEQMMTDKAIVSLRAAVGGSTLEELLHTGKLRRPEEAIEQYLHGGLGAE
ncbi:MAG TPA: hypothetical protein VME46_10850 [Acidimicrobiales bacterium]|nr:hypothetical protein [Acidimicrobiales bacterium]